MRNLLEHLGVCYPALPLGDQLLQYQQRLGLVWMGSATRYISCIGIDEDQP